MEKIKTIGDCYMAVANLPKQRADHADAVAEMALEVQETLGGQRSHDNTLINFRIGINCGAVVGGVIGKTKFAYDLWGDAVNIASRMESTGEAGKIQCTEAFKNLVQGRYDFIANGLKQIKGYGLINTYFLTKKHI
ncbi:MAG: adenylate/guanylate cyclase domain-containing protein [Bacteroidetes bacterium]|nr:adenylate/guanylate cyclase domain-containing protein [Bacteroidota bacterium]